MARRRAILLGILFSIVLSRWGSTEMAEAERIKYKDPTQPVEVRVEDLLGRMNLAEKIGQMTQIDRNDSTPQIMKDYFIGSLLSGGGSVPAPRASPEAWVEMVNAFQRGSMSTRLGIPMIYGIDALHGHNNAYNATIFPHNVGLGATRDPELVKRIGAATALEVRATGIPYTFAPCIAVCRDPRWGRCFESFSEDPRIVRAMTDVILGLQGDLPDDHTRGFPHVAGENKVAACAKHFVGDGGTQNGVNEADAVIDRSELFSIHMPAYYDAIAKGVSTVMISFSSWNGVKMHTNRKLITGFLKNELGFDGFVISDSKGLDKITSPPGANYTYSVEAGISAGIDMVMVPDNYIAFIGNLTHLVKNDFIPMSRIDDAVRRILRVKFILGLFEKPRPDLSFADELGKKEHRELAREAVRKSLVLLKNGKSGDEGPLLPLPKKAARILVAGSHADNLGYQCGGWTIEWHGVSGRITTGTTILEAIRSAVHPDTDVVFSESPDAGFIANNDFSFAVVAVGEHPYAESYGDSRNLTIAAPGPRTIETVCSGGVRCVVVLVTGRPVVIEPYLPSIDALVAAWLPGTEGQGVADVLFGDYGFTGRLPRTWFRTVEQLPMNVGDAHYDPLFPFGFGLTTETGKGIGEEADSVTYQY